MIIDTSAIVSVLLGEPEAPQLIRRIADADKRMIAAFNVLECGVVMEVKKGPPATRELDLFLHEGQIEEIAMNAEQVALAREAYRRFGKGRHRAQLNLGDCCAYALAVHSGEPLLFKGDDFQHTDLKIVGLG